MLNKLIDSFTLLSDKNFMILFKLFLVKGSGPSPVIASKAKQERGWGEVFAGQARGSMY